ncbi:hypothetical protein [Parasphingorhabdus sp.]|jgi:hypothetical protein|uniref:hypothetical protein n=1 Tax=Parasphingorhabdus sp. TaxID=2709688 RepID=UPI003D2937BD
MNVVELSDAKIAKYQFEVPVKRSVEELWSVMIDEINGWWMHDFRALGEDSIISLNPETGGKLLETSPDGGSLEWYQVQMIVPKTSLYLVGYMAADWGGPTTSMLKLALEARGDDSVLIVSDALLGNVTENSTQSASDGWQMLFGDGLKKYAESK